MNIGDQAPNFTLKDGDGNSWSLGDQRGKTVVLLFYPGDNTPVCTAAALLGARSLVRISGDRC